MRRHQNNARVQAWMDSYRRLQIARSGKAFRLRSSSRARWLILAILIEVGKWLLPHDRKVTNGCAARPTSEIRQGTPYSKIDTQRGQLRTDFHQLPATKKHTSQTLPRPKNHHHGKFQGISADRHKLPNT
jgi:hypothetical protein